jgi:hypothetical protein
MQIDEAEPNIFSLPSLRFCFQLLRNDYPALALELQNIIMEANQDNDDPDDDCDNDTITLNLDVKKVSCIVSAISDIAEKAAHNEFHSKKNLIAIHSTLLEWLLYAQNFTQDLQLVSLDPQLKSPTSPSEN